MTLALQENLQDKVQGSLRHDVALGATSWMGVGGVADTIFKPHDHDDLQKFLTLIDSDIPLTILGATSNLLIRDGGLRGIVIRLGAAFAGAEIDNDGKITAGAALLDMNLARFAEKHERTGLEFFIGIPGSVGGALFMNAGAYGTETKDVLQTAFAFDRLGKTHQLSVNDLDMQYRHTNAADKGLIFTHALFNTKKGDVKTISARMDEIRNARQDTQPVKARTGGSTFANPTAEECHKADLPQIMKSWQLIDAVGGRGMKIGGATMSEKHCNFMLNAEGTATAFDLELLGETLRKKVYEQFGIILRWEIKRVGDYMNPEQQQEIEKIKSWENSK